MGISGLRRDNTPMIENQMEKQMENRMETGIAEAILRVGEFFSMNALSEGAHFKHRMMAWVCPCPACSRTRMTIGINITMKP